MRDPAARGSRGTGKAYIAEREAEDKGNAAREQLTICSVAQGSTQASRPSSTSGLSFELLLRRLAIFSSTSRHVGRADGHMFVALLAETQAALEYGLRGKLQPV
jgi:hypothetical protein